MTIEQFMEEHVYMKDKLWNDQVMLNLIVEYAHLMCEKQKEICADNAEADYNWVGDSRNANVEVYVLRESIIQCKNATEI
jgi:hypothetical protein